MKVRNLLISCAALMSTVGIAVSAGLFWGYPIVGSGTYCISYQNPTVVNGVVTSQGTCTSTASAGPLALTGNELLIADTQLPGGQTPQTVYVPAAQLFAHGQGSERNALRGGDFLTNLWQRGTSFASATPTTAAYTADGWAMYSSGNTVTINQQTGAADISPTLGVNAVMRVVRPSGTNTTSICVGQILPKAESERFIGNEAIFSFYALANSGYLQTNQTVIATIYAWTSADSATPNTNTDAMMKGTLTNQSIIVGNQAQTQVAAVTTAAPVIPLTASMVRYWVAGTVPVTINGTAVLGVGVTLCTGAYPASTGVAGDYFEFGNAQLESSAAPVLVNGVAVSAGNTAPGGFARRTPGAEANLELSYSYVVTDGAATVRYAAGFSSTNALAQFFMQYPVEMRETPTLTVGTTVSFAVLHQTTTSACGTSIAAVASSGNRTGSGLLCTTGGTALTAGEGSLLVGAATGGLLTFSAEP